MVSSEDENHTRLRCKKPAIYLILLAPPTLPYVIPSGEIHSSRINRGSHQRLVLAKFLTAEVALIS